jgi:hypothetical protein
MFKLVIGLEVSDSYLLFIIILLLLKLIELRELPETGVLFNSLLLLAF